MGAGDGAENGKRLEPRPEGISPNTLKDNRSRSRKHGKIMTAVDLYCGCGGVTVGLKRKGYKVVAAVDNDPVACATYRANHSDVCLLEKDVRSVDPGEIFKRHLNGRRLDLLVVCAPCQPFSSLNRKRRDDERSELILQASRFAKILRPAVILFENVPGLASTEAHGILSRLREELAEVGYVLGEPKRIDAADYGVPQRRARCILFSVPAGRPMPKFPIPKTPEGKRITVRQAIGKLKPLGTGEKDPRDPLHFSRRHLPIALERLQHVPKDGGDRFSLPPDLELACHKGHRGHPDVYGRMRWDDVAPTLTTGCTDVTRGRFAHPRDDRAISLREAALLQTFPKRYRFAGCPGEVATQIGNAVPVRLIEAIAPVLRKTARRRRRK